MHAIMLLALAVSEQAAMQLELAPVTNFPNLTVVQFSLLFLFFLLSSYTNGRLHAWPAIQKKEL